MTAYGSEEIAMRALRAGAANYIAKKNIANELVPLVRQVLEMAAWSHERVRILRCLVRHESVFVLENDPNLIAAFMKLVREELEGMEFWDETGLIQVSIALQEALTNAVFHGNLEVDSEYRADRRARYSTRSPRSAGISSRIARAGFESTCSSTGTSPGSASATTGRDSTRPCSIAPSTPPTWRESAAAACS